MSYLTVRNLSADLARELKKEARKRGTSLNGTVIELLRRALGLDHEAPFDNGLGKLAGKWTEEEFKEFEKNTAFLEQIDEELWR